MTRLRVQASLQPSTGAVRIGTSDSQEAMKRTQYLMESHTTWIIILPQGPEPSIWNSQHPHLVIILHSTLQPQLRNDSSTNKIGLKPKKKDTVLSFGKYWGSKFQNLNALRGQSVATSKDWPSTVNSWLEKDPTFCFSSHNLNPGKMSRFSVHEFEDKGVSWRAVLQLRCKICIL